MRAFNLTRTDHFYRHEMFSEGLRAAGYRVQSGRPQSFETGDVLLIWNRYGERLPIAAACEAAGGRVIVAENGYIGIGGQSPHSMEDRDPYALALGWHNDSSVIRPGGSSRWDALGIDVQPWQNNEDGHILICPNRPFGAPGRAMPFDWAEDAAKRFKQATGREIRIRNHPGNKRPEKSIADDLRGAYACVIWSSSIGVHALVAGIPVVCEAPYWICKEAAGIGTAGGRQVCDRMESFGKLAYGQWFQREIASGEAFRWLLQ